VKAVEQIVSLKSERGIPYGVSCERAGVAASSFRRWKSRRACGKAILEPPGPRKSRPVDVGRLREEIAALGHGQRRTRGTKDLYRRYADGISRRDLDRLVDEVHREEQRQKRRIVWLRAGLVWSMDDSRWKREAEPYRVHLHVVEDLGSRYKMDPLAAGRLAKGIVVASNLAMLFRQWEPPLFLKRDNGGNLESAEVHAVMSQAQVLPLNSPGYYPQYNGGMERGQRDLKEELARLDGRDLRCGLDRVQDWALLAATRGNARTRRVLAGRTACELFLTSQRDLRWYNGRRRKGIFDWLSELTMRIVDDSGKTGKGIFAAGWRIAAQAWLQKNGVIRVLKRGESVTRFLPQNRS